MPSNKRSTRKKRSAKLRKLHKREQKQRREFLKRLQDGLRVIETDPFWLLRARCSRPSTPPTLYEVIKHRVGDKDLLDIRILGQAETISLSDDLGSYPIIHSSYAGLERELQSEEALQAKFGFNWPLHSVIEKLMKQHRRIPDDVKADMLSQLGVRPKDQNDPNHSAASPTTEPTSEGSSDTKKHDR